MTRVPVHEVMQAAQNHVNEGEFAEAEETYRAILAQAPQYAEASYALGMLKARFAENGEAIELLGRAIAANPAEARYHDSLGTLYKAEQRIPEAIACFERAIQLRPDDDEMKWRLSSARMEQMELNAPACRISYLIASRNDHFCGNPMDRLRLVLRRILEVGGDFEIVVADWGSDVPIYEGMKPQLPATGKIRFLHISKSVTEGMKTPFSEVHALNAAVRRSRGIFAGRLDQDTLIGDRFAGWVANVLEADDRRAYFSMRRDLKPGVTRIDRKAAIWRGVSADWPRFFTGGVGILLAPRRLWHWTRGYDESLIYRNHMEHDLCLRLANLNGLRNLGVLIECDFYHLWHEEPTGVVVNKPKALEQIAADARANLRVNDESWGLGECAEQIREQVL